jgi:hypothetical protein
MISLESQQPVTVSDRKNRDWVILHCSSLDEVDAAIKNKPFIHSHIIRGVRRMLEKRATSDMCLEIWCNATYSSIWVSIRLEEARMSLKKILDYRVAIENYEECDEIVQLISEVGALEAEVQSRKREADKSPGAPDRRTHEENEEN